MGAECRTPPPNPSRTVASKHRPRTPTTALLQSPTSHAFPLGSNDDELERAQARAARAASIRRRSFAPNPSAATSTRHDLLDRDQIMDLFHNCVKLASENVRSFSHASLCCIVYLGLWSQIFFNFFSLCSFCSVYVLQKINQKNTWELGLIDHLSEIIRVRPEDDDETNFQKVSFLYLFLFFGWFFWISWRWYLHGKSWPPSLTYYNLWYRQAALWKLGWRYILWESIRCILTHTRSLEGLIGLAEKKKRKVFSYFFF